MHIAIIPDGNRRWAKERGLNPWEGHEEGAKRIEELVREALELKIKYISFWGSSADNLKKRPFQEKRALLKIYESYFKRLIDSKDIYKNQARIGIFGLWRQQFPETLKKTLELGIEKTRKHSGCFLNFLLAYSGDEDLIYGVRKVAEKFKSGIIKEINHQTIKDNLMTAPLPDIDLIIRTGVEDDPHNSAGFMMWQTQNSQYYFSNKRFPDFNKRDFKIAIADFEKRARRMGS